MNRRIKAGLMTIVFLGLLVLLAMFIIDKPSISIKVIGATILIWMIYQMCYDIIEEFF